MSAMSAEPMSEQSDSLKIIRAIQDSRHAIVCDEQKTDECIYRRYDEKQSTI